MVTLSLPTQPAASVTQLTTWVRSLFRTCRSANQSQDCFSTKPASAGFFIKYCTMFDDLKPLLILSPQRTGSHFVLNRLHEKFYAGVPTFAFNEVDEALKTNEMFVGISHNRYQEDELMDCNVVYCVRRSIADSILSRVIADNGQGTYTFDASEREVLYHLAYQEAWFVHYCQQLDRQSNVVVYEVLEDIFPNVFTSTVDKRRVVLNYDQIVEFINSNIKPYFQQAHESFCDYPAQLNGQLMYKLLV